MFPRLRRYTLGERLEEGLIKVLEALVEAAYSRDKKAAPRRANLRLEGVRHRWRLAHELRVIPLRRYEHGAELMNDVGRQVGGLAACAVGRAGEAPGKQAVKRLGGIWAEVTGFDNLPLAYRKARRGKGRSPLVDQDSLSPLL